VPRIKLFLSHAHEDKDDFVRPLAEALRADFKVWYDEYELKLGDSLRGKIDEGLRTCDYGVVVLSPNFFAKKWPKAELDGLFSLETKERKVILPIWKDVTEDDVRKFSPILAGRLGVSTDEGIAKVMYEIKRAVGLVDRYKGSSGSWLEREVCLAGCEY
jgi:TIR domain